MTASRVTIDSACSLKNKAAFLMHSGLTYGVLCSDEDYYFLKVEGEVLLSSKIVKVSAFQQASPFPMPPGITCLH